MNKYFNLRRFGLLLKHDILTSYKMGIYFLTVVGLYTFLAVIIFAVNRVYPQRVDLNSLNYMFPGFLFLGGYIFTSLVFSDINDKFKSSLWFSLPASTLEKYLAAVLISSIGYVIFIVISFVAASLISNVVTRPIFGHGMAIFNPLYMANHENELMLDPDYRELYTVYYSFFIYFTYLFSHSIYLVGSIVFKKISFIKTSLVSSAVSIVYSIIFAIMGYYIYKWGIVEEWDIRIFESIYFYVENASINETMPSLVVKWIMIPSAIFSLFFNVVGYFKLAEKEVKGGV